MDEAGSSGFGARLRQMRTRKGMSQQDLAGDFVTASYVSLLESNARQPTLDVIVYLARRLGTSVRELAGAELLAGVDESSQGATALKMILARSAASYGDLAKARGELTELLAHYRAQRAPFRVMETGFDLLDVMFAQADHEGRYQLSSELLSVAEEVGSPELLLKIIIDHASAARETGHLAQAEDYTTRALTMIGQTSLKNTGEHVRLLGIRLATLCDAGLLDQVPSLIAELRERAAVVGCAGIDGRAHWAIALALARLGQHDLAAAEIETVRAIFAQTHMSLREWLHFCRSAASVLIESPDGLATAGEYLAGAKAALATVILPYARALLDVVYARYQLAINDPQAAVATCESVVSSGVDLPETERARLNTVWGRSLRALGRPREAADRLRAAALSYEQLNAQRNALDLWHEIDECYLSLDQLGTDRHDRPDRHDRHDRPDRHDAAGGPGPGDLH
jgi:transcriptional regulator with XRE-family HTH domain